jgi:hypothetical protein
LIFLNNSAGGGGPPGGGGGGACEKALLQKVSSPKHTIRVRSNCFTFFMCDNQLVKTKLRCYYKNCKGELLFAIDIVVKRKWLSKKMLNGV